ncbi:Uncharacterised protein [Mycoplasmopsis californica]|uniref:DUF3923 family protein n=1 Tax=Mycoplasmopsis equigenitalium TaxID=114883 RepID=A0ABY5J1B0_9BACT|nr:hypothetical protein [Mycoplasmopsis equigenitalium]UUD37040.1 hypothetical protein NPA09_00480 [Mycoplasmopsis equigenitalium]VEU69660.1 Uncharacterised protein [Mycoplasmopsis californica]
MSSSKNFWSIDKLVQIIVWATTGIWMLGLIVVFAFKTKILADDGMGQEAGNNLVAALSLIFLFLLIASVTVTVVFSFLNKRKAKEVK